MGRDPGSDRDHLRTEQRLRPLPGTAGMLIGGDGVLWQWVLPVAVAPPGYREARKLMIRAIISWAKQREQRQALAAVAAGRSSAALASPAVCPTELRPERGRGAHAQFLRVACREL